MRNRKGEEFRWREHHGPASLNPPEASLLLDSAWWPFQDSTQAWDKEIGPIVSLSAQPFGPQTPGPAQNMPKQNLRPSPSDTRTGGHWQEGDSLPTWCYISSETPSLLRKERIRLWVSVYPSLILVSSSSKWRYYVIPMSQSVVRGAIDQMCMFSQNSYFQPWFDGDRKCSLWEVIRS